MLDARYLATVARAALTGAALAAVLACPSPPSRADASAAAPTGLSTPPARPWNVVILNEADPTLPAFVAIDASLRGALKAPGHPPVNVYAETIDAFRFPTARIEDGLVALMMAKYGAMPVDAVVTFGAASLAFAERHRDRIWHGAAIVFQGIPVEAMRDRTFAPRTTGIPLQHDFAGTGELALALRPQTRRLVVIVGSGQFDDLMARLAHTQLEPIARRIPVEHWSNLPLDEVLQRVARLDRDDAVIFPTFNRDPGGRTHAPAEVLAKLTAASAAPIYSMFETLIERGAVAGMTYSYADRGRRLGELVHEVLANPDAEHPPVALTSSTCLANADALERYGLSERRLPAGCEVRFGRPTLWREYRWWVLGALAVLVAQSALILALAWQRRARRKAEDEARHRRAELAQASRLALAGELTASIAHEINQPLGAILANAGAAESLLRRGVANGDTMRAIVADIKEADLRASDVIRRVRALVTSREIERKPESVNAIVDDILTFLRGEAERRGVAVEATFAPGLPAVELDRVQLQQVVVNLCVNAMDAMAAVEPGKRRLVVRTSATADGGVEVEVSDTGPGIADEELARLFESFFTTKPHGMGLGLSISRSIVEAHGGRISARNSPGGGACLRIELPAQAPADGSVDAASDERPATAAGAMSRQGAS